MNPISTLAIASSGLRAASLRSNAAASNIANLLSKDYRRLSLSQTETPGGGVSVQIERSNEPGEALFSDVLNQMGAVYSFKANILSIRTADKLAGSVLSLHA